MDSLESVKKMIALTVKKQEALVYLRTLLKDPKNQGDLHFKQWYFNRKQKIEQAILKVDIEFLDVYHHFLKAEGLPSVEALPKGKFEDIKILQKEIQTTKHLEKDINNLENVLLDIKKQCFIPAK